MFLTGTFRLSYSQHRSEASFSLPRYTSLPEACVTVMRFALVLLFAISLFSQDAKVVSLAAADAARAKSAYDAMKKAEADWQAVQTEIEHKYASDSREEEDLNVSSGTLISGDLAVYSPFECASTGAVLRIKNNGDGTYTYEPSAEDQDCVRKRKERESQEALDRAKAARDSEERRKHPKMHTVYTLKDGWQSGFTFSQDFSVIVPKPEYPTPGRFYGGLYSGTTLSVPAVCTPESRGGTNLILP